jgi:aryl-alcohol dehydrogenase-like predicted oxidoreductase
MEKRRIGQSGIAVSPLCLGGNVFGWTADEETSHDVLDAFVGAGGNFIDTADSYSRWVPGHQGGESETIIGNWMKARKNRERVVIATKVGWEIAPDRKGLSKDYIHAAVEDSLRRLQTDHIDLYQAHVDDTGTPLEETLEAFAELVEDGKVRAIGASNYSAARLAEAQEVSSRFRYPRYDCLQPGYNLYDREEYESGPERLCRANDIAVIPYFSLGAGFLTGKYRSEKDLEGKARGGRVAKYLNERGFRILEALDEVSAGERATPAQVALAWLMARPGITAPIASATSVKQLNELVGATRVKLSAASLKRLDEASAWKKPAA